LGAQGFEVGVFDVDVPVVVEVVEVGAGGELEAEFFESCG
jgi:hypothetical protein